MKSSFTDDALQKIIREYTREAGVRNLERKIGAVCRKVGTRIAEGKLEKAEITPELVEEYLDHPIFQGTEETEPAHLHPGCGARPGLDALRRRCAVRRSHQHARRQGLPGHRLDRQCDERIGAGGPVLCALAGQAAWPRAGVLRQVRYSHAYPGRRDSPRMAPRPV